MPHVSMVSWHENGENRAPGLTQVTLNERSTQPSCENTFPTHHKVKECPESHICKKYIEEVIAVLTNKKNLIGYHCFLFILACTVI